MFKLLKVGHCTHPEAVVLGTWSLRIMQFPALVGLIKHPCLGYILFDTGYAKRIHQQTQHFPERLYKMVTPMHLCDKENLIVQLQTLNIAADDIRYIFISHFHADHVAGLMDFPNATFICSRQGLTSVQQRGRLRGLMNAYLAGLLPTDFVQRCRFIEAQKTITLPKNMQPFQYAVDLFNDGSCLAIELPGHAFGHYGLLLYDRGKPIFLVADACWSDDAYRYQKKPLAIAKLIMSDSVRYDETVGKLGQLYARNKTLTIIPSHCQKSYDDYQRS